MIPRRASCPTLPVAHWMTLYGTLLSLLETADGDAVVAGIRAALQPAVVVTANDLADTEPVLGDGQRVPPAGGEGLGVEPGFHGQGVAAEPEGPRLIEGLLDVHLVIEEVGEDLDLTLGLHRAADDTEHDLGVAVAADEARDDRVERALAAGRRVRVGGIK